MAKLKDDLDGASKINALGPFPFLRLPQEIQLMIYDLHFRQYNSHLRLESYETQRSAKAGTKILSVSKKIYTDALPRLVRNTDFVVQCSVDGQSITAGAERNFNFADKLSFVGPRVANLIEYLDLEICINLDTIGWVTMDWTGLKTMERLKVLNVAMDLEDCQQMAWCAANYERSVVLKSLVEGLIRALPSTCELKWYDQTDDDVSEYFCPPDVANLRERINPYQSRTSAHVGHDRS